MRKFYFPEAGLVLPFCSWAHGKKYAKAERFDSDGLRSFPA